MTFSVKTVDIQLRSAALNSNQCGCKWSHPSTDMLKFKVDGSYEKSTGAAGICMIARDCDGNLVDGFCGRVIAGSADMSEAFAVRRAVQMAISMKVDEAIIESDCEELMKWMNGTVVGP